MTSVAEQKRVVRILEGLDHSKVLANRCLNIYYISSTCFKSVLNFFLFGKWEFRLRIF